MTGSGDDETRSVRITLAPTGDFFPQASTAWNDELNDLYRAVDRELGDAIERPAGYRGPVTIGMIILTLVSSGALSALIGCIKAWIQTHPGRRSLDVTVTAGGTEKHLVIDARNVDDKTLLAAVTGALKSGR